MSHARHDPPPPHPLPPPPAPLPPSGDPVRDRLADANERTWIQIGNVAETMGALDKALSAYEHALRHNPQSVYGLCCCANILRIKEKYSSAVEYYTRALSIDNTNGDIWSSLGHCYLMQDQLQKAYSAYQQALYHLPNPKEDAKLWYGIGILYDRYGSLEHAEEAFHSVLRMNKDGEKPFDKSNEILFRLGIIYKQQGTYEKSLRCFMDILKVPPAPLAQIDIYFQIGHVYEQLNDYDRAKEAYERVVIDAPNHAKVLQQLGWLYNLSQASFQNNELAVQYLTKSLESDASDAQSWYLLGRAYMSGQKYSKAYEAYQQAVYRDGRNPTFWCSIGVLYFQINQFRDALDAYSRAIRINPYISEVWFDLGSLYESCNNQVADAIDAYERANELDPTNPLIRERLQLLKSAQKKGTPLPAPPPPRDVHPTAYASGPPRPQPPPGSSGAQGGAGGGGSGADRLFTVQQGMPQGTPGSLAMFASGLAQRPGAAAAAAGVDTPVHPGPGGPSPPFADERAMREREMRDREMRERELRERELRERELRERERMDMREREREREMVVRERERSVVRPRGGEDRMAVDEPPYVPPSRAAAGPGAARWDASPPAQPRARPGSPSFGGQQQQQAGYQRGGPPQQQQVPESPRYRYDDAPGPGGAAGWDRERERDRDTRRAANGHGHHHSHSHSAHSTHSHHGHPGAPPPQQPGQPTRAGGRDILESHPRDARPEMGSRTASAAYATPTGSERERASYGAERSPMMPTGSGREREFRGDRVEREREFRSSPENRRRSDDRMQVDSRERESWGGAPTQWDRGERERERQQQPTPPAPQPAASSRRYDPRMDGASETGPSPPPRGVQQPRQPSFGGRPEWRERDRERERERERELQETLPRPDLRERPSSPRVGDKRRHEGVDVPSRGRRTPSVNGGAPASNGKDKLDSPRSDRGTPVRKPLSTSAPVPPSTNGNGVTRSPTSAGATTTTSRTLDENYDEGVADALIGLASSRPRIQAPVSSSSQAPPSAPAPAPVSSNFGSAQPSTTSVNEGTANGLKRPLSPEPSSAGSEGTNKRQRIGPNEGNGATDMTLPPIATLSPTSPASTSAGDDDAKRGSPSRRGASPARSAGSRGSGTAALRSPRGSTPRAEA